MCPSNHKQEPDFSTFLPSVIIIDILLRLPIRTIVICKCVCRSWRDLIRTPHFANLHLSKSASGLVISWGSDDEWKVFEFDNLQHHHLQFKPLTKIDSVELAGSVVHGSANGLLLLSRGVEKPASVCNPITRESIELPLAYSYSWPTMFTFGFGVSRMSGLYKVVAILQDLDFNGGNKKFPKRIRMSICLVYTLGTGMWRAIKPPAPFLHYSDRSFVVCLNGNLHWLVQVSKNSFCILRLDLETETFSTFSLPCASDDTFHYVGLAVMGDCLCVSDKTSSEYVVIWSMKEYGNEKSWTRGIIDIGRGLDDAFDTCSFVDPIKVFKDGDILIALQDYCMIYYSNKTETTEKCQLFGESNLLGMKAMFHRPSLLSLGSFANETVSRY